MAYALYKEVEPKSTYEYVDKQFQGTPEEYKQALAASKTVYVGNLSFSTTEDQVWELFGKAGPVKSVVVGLNREKMTPCGFAFVEYFARKDAEDSLNWIGGTKLDDRIIRVDLDFGFVEGRQFGRGKSGGQIRDDYRDDYDPGRGGYSTLKNQQIDEKPRDEDRGGQKRTRDEAPDRADRFDRAEPPERVEAAGDARPGPDVDADLVETVDARQHEDEERDTKRRRTEADAGRHDD